MDSVIRLEQASDKTAIEHVHTQAFGQPDEAVLVNNLRDSGGLAVSLVAVIGGEVVGQIAFSPMVFDDGPDDIYALGLAPLAVLPQFQRRGIGLKLMEAGLKACRQAGAEVVIVLGHPEYYPKAGSAQAAPHGIFCEFEVPEEAFMVLELVEGALGKVHGMARYHQAFHQTG